MTRSRSDPEARALLESDGDPARRLAELRALAGEAGAAVTDYLDLVGYRLARRLRHLRAATRSSCPTRCCGRSGSPSRDGDLRAPTCRRAHRRRSARRCPRSTAREFDELLGEARLMYRLRDERGVYSDIWASGSCAAPRSRPVAGSRPRAASHDAEHFVDASFDEMCALVTRHRRAVGRRARGARRSTAPRTPPRTRRRSSATRRTAAARPVGPPARRRPRHARHRHRARLAVRQLGGRARARTCCAASPRAPASTRARRACVAGPSEFDRIEQGDVLVTPVDHRGVQHPAAAARRDRHRQRRPALALGDRRARVRHPRRGRHARRDRPHRRRHARARRRRRRRSDGAR